MTKGLTIANLVHSMKGHDITTFIRDQHYQFTERFGLNYDEPVMVTLKFESQQDAHDFYNEIRMNPTYAQEYTVTSHPFHELSLCVTGQATLYDYFGSREPNLLTISRDLDLRFEIEFVQSYSKTTFTGSVNHGELLSRQCLIEVSDVLPELTLGGLVQIGRSEREFEDLLTRCYIVKGMSL